MRVALLGLLALAAAMVACKPAVVMNTDATGGELELDEAESRCFRGEACACYALAQYKRNEGDDASEEFTRSCQLGCAPGCAAIRDSAFDSATPRVADGTAAAVRACKLDAKQCAPAGARFEQGRGAPLDKARARAFYDEGCRGGVAEACAGRDRIGASPR